LKFKGIGPEEGDCPHDPALPRNISGGDAELQSPSSAILISRSVHSNITDVK
jgi:hypothetical protein